MEVLIVGGGIGGLATALLLGVRGFKCQVFEQAPEIRELGVGINLLPHAVKVLAQQGLLGRLQDVALETEELIYTNRFGQTVWHEPRGRSAGYDVPQFSIHRGRLQTVLREAVEQRFGPLIRTGHHLVDATQAGCKVTASFETAGGVAAYQGDALIGADGIHSMTRKILFPNIGPVSWNGILIWRGAVDWPAFLTGRSMVIAGGMKEKIVVYPIAEGSAPDRRLTNWSVNVKIADHDTPIPVKEDWSRIGRRAELVKHVGRFALPFLDIRKLIDASEEFWEYPMCDRDALPHWSNGRITLLGDAAHPMYPTGSNGAGQAILDAECLSRNLALATTIEDALRTYQAERLPATAEIVARNRLGGPEMVIDAVEQLAPEGFDDVDMVLSYEQRRSILADYAAKAGFARTQVNR